MKVLLSIAILLYLSSVTDCAAADMPEVARVNGREITASELENELLRREGVELIEELVSRYVAGLDWSRFDNDAVILTIGGREFRRLELVAKLLQDHGASVRTELINLQVARDALDRAAVPNSEEVLQAEWDRMRQAFEEKLAAEGKPFMPFANYLEVHENQTREAFMAEPGFVLAARLHAYVHQVSEVPIDQLKEHFVAQNHRFVEYPARRLSVIHMPFEVREIAGRQVVDRRHKDKLTGVLERQREAIVNGRSTFAKVWQAYGRGWDPESEHGDVGWVRRDGTPERVGARQLPIAVMDAVWQADLSDGSVLLPVIAHDRGCDLVRVDAARPGRDPEFIAVLTEVRADYIEEHLEGLTRQASNDMTRDAEIEYGEFHRLLKDRAQAARVMLRAVREAASSAAEEQGD